MRYAAFDTAALDAALVAAGDDLCVCDASKDAAILIPALINAFGATACIEIGVDHGYTSLIAMEAMKQCFGAGSLIAVDIEPDSAVRVGFLAQRYPMIHVMPVTAASGSLYLRSTAAFMDICGQIGFAFVDGGHGYETCLSDLNDVWEVMSPNGAILCHDYYMRKGYGVVQAVQEFAAAKNLDKWVWPQAKGAAFALLRMPPNVYVRNGRAALV